MACEVRTAESRRASLPNRRNSPHVAFPLRQTFFLFSGSSDTSSAGTQISTCLLQARCALRSYGKSEILGILQNRNTAAHPASGSAKCRLRTRPNCLSPLWKKRDPWHSSESQYSSTSGVWVRQVPPEDSPKLFIAAVESGGADAKNSVQSIALDSGVLAIRGIVTAAHHSPLRFCCTRDQQWLFLEIAPSSRARNIRYQGLFGRPYAKILAAQLHIRRVESSPRRVSHGEPLCLLLRHELSRIQLFLARARCEMELHRIPCECGLERKFAGAAISGSNRAGTRHSAS